MQGDITQGKLQNDTIARATTAFASNLAATGRERLDKSIMAGPLQNVSCLKHSSKWHHSESIFCDSWLLRLSDVGRLTEASQVIYLLLFPPSSLLPLSLSILY